MASPDSKFKLLHLNAENCVTGSCHLLQTNGLKIMVDCGLAQGNDAIAPIEDWPLSPSKIDTCFSPMPTSITSDAYRN